MIDNKNVLFFDGTLMEGGAERVISTLSKGLIERGYTVEILLYYDKEIFYDIDRSVKIKFVERENKSADICTSIMWIRRYFKKYHGTIVSFLAPFNIVALTAHAGLKNPIIVADRNDPRFIPSNPVIRKLRDFLYRFADGAVMQTSQNKAYFSRAVQKKSIVIYNPIDLREKAGLGLRTKKNKKIVSVGRLMPQKNQEMMIKAFAGASKIHPGYTLTVYGEGKQRETLEKLIKVLRLEDKVFLPGSVKDVHDRIADSEIFVLSSDFEGMPNALIEAMCLGLPCVSTKVSGAADFIKDHQNGILVDTRDQAALENALTELMVNERLRYELAHSAMELNASLSIEKISDKWVRYINGIERR